MEWLVNAREMKSCDANTTEFFGMTSLVLMERASLAVLHTIDEMNFNTEKTLVVCGTGNNGGDGLAIARMLYLRGNKVEVYIAGDYKKFSKEMKLQYDIACQYKIPIITCIERTSYTIIVDALFGIGLSRNLENKYFTLLEQLNRLNATKVAVDIPSGISADNGSIMGIAFKADITVTFSYKKLGLLFYPGCEYAGNVVVADIGIEEHSWMDKKPMFYSVDKNDLSKILYRPPYANKGTFGKVLIIGGTTNMSGSVYFSAKSAYSSGCGLVKIYTIEDNRVILQSQLPEAILTTFNGKRLDMNELSDALSWADVIVIGPGLGTNDIAKSILKNTLKNAAVPVVVDADALNIIAEDTQILLQPHTDMVITPHLGEMSRLRKDSISYIQETLIQTAQEFAREYNVICVLKDARTVTAVPYGKTYVNSSGNQGMATGGSGDVLSGVIGGLIAQGIHAELAAPIAVFMHGMAADFMAEQIGCHGLMASDIIEGFKHNIFIK